MFSVCCPGLGVQNEIWGEDYIQEGKKFFFSFMVYLLKFSMFYEHDHFNTNITLKCLGIHTVSCLVFLILEIRLN